MHMTFDTEMPKDVLNLRGRWQQLKTRSLPVCRLPISILPALLLSHTNFINFMSLLPLSPSEAESIFAVMRYHKNRRTHTSQLLQKFRSLHHMCIIKTADRLNQRFLSFCMNDSSCVLIFYPLTFQLAASRRSPIKSL